MEWLVPGAYAHLISQKVTNGEPKILMIKLLKATGLRYSKVFVEV